MDIDAVKLAYEEFKVKKIGFDKMMDYYKSETDAMKNYKMTTIRSDNKVSTNFIQNFVDEEVSYSVGNDSTYISKSGDNKIIEDIAYYLSPLSDSHDINLMEKMLIQSIAYELYYIDKNGDFNSKVITASNGYAILDDYGNIDFFIQCFSKKFDKRNYIDIYDKTYIYHYDDTFKKMYGKKPHNFKDVPVGVSTFNLEEDVVHKTIYSKIKRLQDAYETNLSDISNEVSDYRNAYLKVLGLSIDNEVLAKMKETGVIQSNEMDANVEWLIKDINDTFIQNTLSTLEGKMYQLTNHINHNENVVSNISSLAIKARLIGLQQKCKLNQKALSDCIKTRMRFLFMFLDSTKINKQYDYKDIKVVFSDNLPSDDITTAKMIKELDGKISLETALSQLSFIENPRNEIDKINKEKLEASLVDQVIEPTKPTELTIEDSDDEIFINTEVL